MNERTLFTTALEKDDPDQRKAFLDEACAGDAALRERVETLLGSHERPGPFLDVPAVEQLATADVTQEATPGDFEEAPSLGFLTPSDKPGSLGRLENYDVQEVVGHGGMGIVLKAFDEELHRVVAIKVMAAQLATSATARKRFKREARAAAAVSHDHIVTIHSVKDAGELPYLVMQYVAGLSLQQRLDRDGPLQLHEILRIGMQTASGLAAAHAQGLVHRDIKPANILLENGVERVKITDFGLARAAADASVSQSGIIAGTPQYMAPEQAQGEAVDCRADLFSLGSVLYAMCTGRAPFRASGTVAVLKRVCEEIPTPIRDTNPEIPEWLVAIIDKLHAKDPAERFQSAAEVAELLGLHLAHVQHPSVVGLVSKLPADRSAGRKPALRQGGWAAIAAAAVLLCLLGGLSLTEATGVTHLSATVIRIFTPDGTLVVETDDPAVKVTVEGDGGLVITGAGLEEIRLRPGSYKLRATKDGRTVALDRDLVTITRGDRQIVRIRLEGTPANIASDSAITGSFVVSVKLPAAKDPIVRRYTIDERLPSLGKGPETAAAAAAVDLANARLERLISGARKEEVDMAKANLAAADSEMQALEKEFSRLRERYNRGDISESTYDAAKRAFEAAKAKADAARAQVHLLLAGARPEDIKEAKAELAQRQAQLEQANSVRKEYPWGSLEVEVERGPDNNLALRSLRIDVAENWGDIRGEFLRLTTVSSDLTEPRQSSGLTLTTATRPIPLFFDESAGLDQAEITITGSIKLQLPGETRVAPAATELGAFVVLSGPGVPERKFDTLAEAVVGASDGDTIEIRGNGPYVTDAIDLNKKSLTMRAGTRYAPVIHASQTAVKAKDPLLKTAGSLTLEGLELHHEAVVQVPEHVHSLIQSDSAPLYLTHCKLVYGRKGVWGSTHVVTWDSAIRAQLSPTGQVRNSIIMSPGFGIAIIGSPRMQWTVHNCLIAADDAVWYVPESANAPEARLRLTRNTLASSFGLTILVQPDVSEQIRSTKAKPIVPGLVESEENVYEAQHVLVLSGTSAEKTPEPSVETVARISKELLRWREQGNVYGTNDGRFLWLHPQDHRLLKDLALWNKVWDLKDTGSVQAPVHLRSNPRNQVFVSPESIAVDDFRLRADSAGYRAGPDGKDLGADVDLVGPGEAYERWKKTPEYQEWLRDTGHVR